MICGGVPSKHLVDSFIRSEERWSEVVSFRKKGQYVLTCRNIDGESELLSNSRLLPLYGFFSGLTNRFSCGDCKFAGVERDSDITIGDYWGDNSSAHKSVEIAHSQKGKDLLMNCNDLDVFKTDRNFLKFNYRTIVGKPIIITDGREDCCLGYSSIYHIRIYADSMDVISVILCFSLYMQ